MSTENLLRDVLYIPNHNQRAVSTSRVLCLVHDDWLQNLRQKSVKDVFGTHNLSKSDADLLLAPSHPALPRNWSRLCIKVVRKVEGLVPKLHNGPFYNTAPGTSCMEHLVQSGRENFRNLWAAAHVQHSVSDMETFQLAEDQLTNVLRTYFQRLSPAVYIRLPEKQDAIDPSSANHTYHHDNQLSNNIIPVHAVIETNSVFFIVQPYLSCTLNHVVSYSPAVFDTSHAKSLFVLYQILHAMVAMHQHGLSLRSLNLHNVMVDEKLWVYLSNPQVSHITKCAKKKEIVNDSEVSFSSAVEVLKGEHTDSESLSESAVQNLNSTFHDGTHSEKSVDSQRWNECENYVEEAKQFVENFKSCKIELEDLPRLTEEWTQHKISNFIYLMMLNYLAGRRMGDPNHHPVLPWVMDFTNASSGLRDLRMSKFRLNKGDSQLDFTYEGMSEIPGNLEHIPHHVSDVLSDITYFVYKARRTPKHILCTYVRTKWVPNEYPHSIERMYQWTPDECIPEFFTDPSLFTSIHEDLPDLELPSWCSSASEFIDKHMSMLESEQVSQLLHHWIDLTFGYKLSGAAAVNSKNVYLQLVDQHTTLMNHGVVQLFSHPHPSRPEPDVMLSVLPPRLSKFRKVASVSHGLTSYGERESFKPDEIKLPADFDPTAALDQFEAVHSFASRTSESLPPSTETRKHTALKYSDIHTSVKQVWADMQQFGCLLCELYLAPRLQVQNPAASLQQRYSMIHRLCAKDRTNLPRMVQTAAEILLLLNQPRPGGTASTDQGSDRPGGNASTDQGSDRPGGNASADQGSDRLGGTASIDQGSGSSLLFEYPMVNSLGLPPPSPLFLLQPCSGVLPFPPYFKELYDVLNQMKEYDNEIQRETLDVSKSKQDRRKIQKVLSRKKVELIEKFLRKNRGNISGEGYELILPYIKELFADSKTAVQAAWSLLGVVGKDLGSIALSKNILPLLTKLYSGEETTPKHMKLYHRTFLVQLLLNLGLETFLNNFCTLLVEASAGYKDFLVDDKDEKSQADIDGEDVEEDEEEEEEEEVFLSAHSDLNRTVETQDSTQEHPDQLEVNEDIRPDQMEDNLEETDTSYEAAEDDLDEDFPNLSVGSNSRSVDSISTDQISQKSLESESIQDEESGSLDRASADRASIHSIAHIIEASQENPTREEPNIDETDAKSKQNHIVHFVTDSEQSRSVPSSIKQSKDSGFQTDQSTTYGSMPEDESEAAEAKASSYMIRSETDEFRQIHYSHTINICDVAGESIKWLTHRLGPLLTAKYLSKNLVRMLALCYLGEEQLFVIPKSDDHLPKTTRLVQGDNNAHKVLECLSYVAALYGEHVILLQYIPCIVDLVHVARRRLTVRAEAGLVAAVVLLRQIIPLLSDKTFLEILKENIVTEALRPLLKLVTSVTTSFPSGPTVRNLILYKAIDALYVCGLRLGFEMTRTHMTETLQIFFRPFGNVYSSGSVGSMQESGSATDLQDGLGAVGGIDESYLNIKMDSLTNQYMIGSPVSLAMSPTPMMSEMPRKWRVVKSTYSLSDNHLTDERDDFTDGKKATEENLQAELRQTFSPELALAAYIPLTSVFGSHHMEEHLPSDDLIRKLCAQFDKALYSDNDNVDDRLSQNTLMEEEPEDGDFGSNVAMVGNRICLQGDQLGANPETSQLKKHFEHKGILRLDPDETKCKDLDHNKRRHLKGNWLAYWEHEKGLNARDTLFNFKQIKLQTFTGHANSIRSLTCLDNENSIISASKDKTVKLWSLTNFGDGTGKSRCQWSYDYHKKSVFSVAYLETMRLVASCDSTVHIWDPFTGDTLQQLESPKYSPVIALTPLPSPSSLIMTATTDSTLRFLDLRTAKYAHEYKCVLASAGLIRSISASPDGSWVVVGFSSGVVSLLDLNTGMLMGTWKAHDSEILQLKAYNKNSFVSSSFDMNMKLWNVDDGKEICSFRGHQEPVHCLSFYKNQIVSATTSNKIGVHTSVDSQANFTVTKLTSEVFKGVLTSMAILPLNRTLVLGADNGLIRLLC